MENEMAFEILNVIFDRSYGKTAPVTVQIGYVSDHMCRKGIVLKEACPAIITELVERGYSCDLTKDGLLIHKY